MATQDDVTDGVLWAIDQAIADPKHIAIVGESYGGYAALAGITYRPGDFNMLRQWIAQVYRIY
jgi:dipeptidyl aminopeptidase/acylaminoacyl peptidase